MLVLSALRYVQNANVAKDCELSFSGRSIMQLKYRKRTRRFNLGCVLYPRKPRLVSGLYGSWLLEREKLLPSQ
jgi:hypothetical protein